jgi:uncharacterized protein (TIGR02118 family)
MSIFRKKPNLDQTEFEAYWRDVHAPIALKIPALQRYEQNCTIARYYAGEPQLLQNVDGICKLLFVDETAMQGVMSPEMTRMLMEDEGKFLEGLRTFVVRQTNPVPLSDKVATKCVSLVTRRKDLDPAAFERRWSDAFAEWVAGLRGVCGYSQNFVTARTAERRPVPYEQSPVDCIDELWLEDSHNSQAAKDVLEQMQARARDYADALNSFVVTVNLPSFPQR